MNQNQFNKLLQLIRRTGDKAVLPDDQSDKLFILMDTDDYELLLNNSLSLKGIPAEEMMDHLNDKIALWRSQNQNQEIESYDGTEALSDANNEYSDANFTSPESFNFMDNIDGKPAKVSFTTDEDKNEIVDEPLYFENLEEEAANLSNNRDVISKTTLQNSATQDSDFAGVMDAEEPLDDIVDEGQDNAKFYLEPIE